MIPVRIKLLYTSASRTRVQAASVLLRYLGSFLFGNLGLGFAFGLPLANLVESALVIKTYMTTQHIKKIIAFVLLFLHLRGNSMIDSYVFGKIVIDGKTYTEDVIIIEEKVYSNWWRVQGHFLQKIDLGPILEGGIKTLIVGTGYNGVMRIGEDVREYCKENGIKLIELKSREAVEKYNELEGEGVAAGIHLTC